MLYETVFQLRSLESPRVVREAVNSQECSPPAAVLGASESVWLCAASGALQRFSLTNLTEEQCIATADLLRSIRLQPAAELSVCLEVVAPSGQVLERAAGETRIAYLSTTPTPGTNIDENADVQGEIEAGGEVAAQPARTLTTLHYTSDCDAEELAKELMKVLPAGAPGVALLILTYVLQEVWEWQGSARELEELIFSRGDKRWQKQNLLPEGTRPWLVYSGADAEDEATAQARADDEMDRAMQRERAMMLASGPPTAAQAATQAGFEAQLSALLEGLDDSEELDPVLAAAVERLRQQMQSRTQPLLNQGGVHTSATASGPIGGGASGPFGSGGGGGGGSGGLFGGGQVAPANPDSVAGLPVGPRPPPIPQDDGGSQSPDGSRQVVVALPSGRQVVVALPSSGHGEDGDGGDENGDVGGGDGDGGGNGCHSGGAAGAGGGGGNGEVFHVTNHRGAHGSAGPDSPGRHLAVPPEGSVLVVPWRSFSISPELLRSVGAPYGTDTEAVGLWGERVVAAELMRAAASSDEDVTVIHVNAEEEAGLPYDIEIRSTLADGPTEVRCYVEVKTTVSQDKPLFELSLAEIDKARREGDRYAIYRVFGAGSESVSMASLHNPARHLSSGGGLTLYAGDGA